MGFIPIFLTMGGAILLFFLTVKNTLQRKFNLQKELLFKLKSLNPELGLLIGETQKPEELISLLKNKELTKSLATKASDLIREMKINRHQYNQLIKKGPYNWVAKISGFQEI